MRDGIEERLELDVIIGGDTGQAPFGELVILRGKACQHRLFHGLEQMAAADAKAAHADLEAGLDVPKGEPARRQT